MCSGSGIGEEDTHPPNYAPWVYNYFAYQTYASGDESGNYPCDTTVVRDGTTYSIYYLRSDGTWNPAVTETMWQAHVDEWDALIAASGDQHCAKILGLPDSVNSPSTPFASDLFPPGYSLPSGITAVEHNPDYPTNQTTWEEIYNLYKETDEPDFEGVYWHSQLDFAYSPALWLTQRGFSAGAIQFDVDAGFTFWLKGLVDFMTNRANLDETHHWYKVDPGT